MRILVAEDERDLNRLISEELEEAGYSVDRCYDGGEAMDFVDSAVYDAAVLDIMMPVKSGREVVREMRARGISTPVLFLTALDGVDDRVAGLDDGADDYLVKPFAFPELLARLRAMTRKYARVKSSVLTAGELTLDTASRRVARGGREINLSVKEFAILEYLMRNKGVVLSREKIENNAWNYDYEGGSNVVDVYISYLRRKIDGGFDKKLLHTVRGAGWMIKEEE
ncbi:MAG TPA: response regulator transcription factor [Candidatus Caccocola faecipullorum]|nr:response regulator transcription factor [Candidatus Caccocola faecipullorum]